MLLPELQNVNLAVRFLLELCVLAALGYWGFHSGKGVVAKVGLGIGIPIVVAVIWGLFGAPGATKLLVEPWHLILEIVIFGSAVIALFASGHRTVVWVFLVINRVLMYVWNQ